MTAFLFIPASVGGSRTRQVDFGNIASLFAEAEEAAPRRGAARTLLRAMAAVLLMLLAVGDTLLVARPAALCTGVGLRLLPTSART